MKFKEVQILTRNFKSKEKFWVLLFLVGASSCSTMTFEPAERLPPEKETPSEKIVSSEAINLQHPEDASLSALENLFAKKSVPNWSKETNEKCEEPILTLKDKSRSLEEFHQGVKELIHQNPSLFHWCFYGKILELEKQLNAEVFILEKQNLFINTFKFLAPLSKAFLSETLDSRYYRYSIARYQQLSERLFFKKVEVQPEVTERLIQVHQSESSNRAPANLDASQESVLKKHQIPLTKDPIKTMEDPWKVLDQKPEESYPSEE